MKTLRYDYHDKTTLFFYHHHHHGQKMRSAQELQTLWTGRPNKKIGIPKRMGHFQSKNLYCRFWTFKQGFLSTKLKSICGMIFRK